jgi:hypothetical protein
MRASVIMRLWHSSFNLRYYESLQVCSVADINRDFYVAGSVDGQQN